ncbi:DUF4190 domain-containing protein [Streptomyces roseoviridis]|uniref:DUF4190 domain-containing protein n=1 Tax=Streptomyces roseoviridis TaxID=67361 RepID=A0ABV5QQ08_9ACTN
MDPFQPPQDSPAPQQPPQPPRQGGPVPGPYASPGPYTSPPPGPYGPYGPGGPGGAPGVPGPYGVPRQSTNGLAVASLVSGIVCCLPPLGLVFGLIALPQIRKKQQKGKGMAITGIVLSSLACLMMALGFTSGSFADAWREFDKGMDEAAADQSPFSLRKGDCFRVDGKLETYATDVKTVPCTTPHEGEVSGGFKITGFTRWPGEDAIDRIAEDRCQKVNSAYALDTWAVPEDALTYYYLPSKESWRLGDRAVTCTLATEGAPFTRSLRSDESTLDADQVHFLKQMNPIDDALFEEPDKDADADLAGNKAWARKVHRAVTTAGDGLRGHTWPDGSAKPVGELAEKLETAARKWRALATAKDADAFWEVYEAAYDALTTDAEKQSRSALGLTDTLEEGSDGGGATGGGGTGGSGGSGESEGGGEGGGRKV